MKKLLMLTIGLALVTQSVTGAGIRDARSARSETELPPRQTDAGALVFYRDTGYGTDGEEKVQRGFQTSDGGFLAIGVTDDAGGEEAEFPDRVDLHAMDHHPELLFGFWMTVALIETDDDGNVLGVEPSEESMWEEFDLGDDNSVWLFMEQYDPERIVESETSFEWDEADATLIFDDPEVFDGEPLLYGIQDGYLYLQTDDVIRVLAGEGGGHSDALVIKVDREFNLLWQHRFGSPEQFDVGYTATEVADGYIVAGGAAVDEDYPQERWMAKLDKDTGRIIWEQHYLNDSLGYQNSPDFSADAIHDVIIADNGNLIASGYIAGEEYGFSFMNWGGFAFVMEIDPEDGSVISEYIDIDRDEGERLPTLMMGRAVEEADGGFYVAGDNGFIPGDRVEAAISFYSYDQGGDLTRVFTSYIPGDVSAIDMTPGLDGGVVIAGHVRMEVANPDHEEWAPFRIAVTKLSRNSNPVPGDHDEMSVDWQTFFYNPREFPEVDGDNYIRDEVWGVLTVLETDGYEHDGYVFVAGDGDETDDVDEESTAYDVPGSSTWMSYVGFLYPDGTPDWDEVYYTEQDSEELGHEAGEYIATTDDGGFVIFVDTDNQTDAPNAFGFTEIGPR